MFPDNCDATKSLRLIFVKLNFSVIELGTIMYWSVPMRMVIGKCSGFRSASRMAEFASVSAPSFPNMMNCRKFEKVVVAFLCGFVF